MRFRAFIGEDSAAVIAQMRKIRDQMRVIKLKRDLEKEKDELHSNKINMIQRSQNLSKVTCESFLIFD